MKGGPTDPPNKTGAHLIRRRSDASMKGGPTDPPNGPTGLSPGERFIGASMKGGPTDPPNSLLILSLLSVAVKLQ